MNEDNDYYINWIIGIIVGIGAMYLLMINLVDDPNEFNKKLFEFIKMLLTIFCVLLIGIILIFFPDFKNWLKKPLNQQLFEDGQLYSQLKIDDIIEPKTNSKLVNKIGSVYLLKGKVNNLKYEQGIPQSYYYKAKEYFEWVNNNPHKIRKEDKLRVNNKGKHR